ncbi:penicillin-binding protein, partial [Salmonella enterica subsp. enterica serovar Typhimurium]
MEGRQFNRRTLAILVGLTALLLLFFGVLYNLQVLHVDDYRAQSVVKIANRKTVEAARGELLDRYGRSMVTNRATYQLTL